MKKYFIILTFIFCEQNLFAQMDEKFYFPDKDWVNIDSLNYQDIFFPVDNDTVHSILVKPNGTVKATVIYFHGNGNNISKWVNLFKPLINDNFQVCLFDYRGYGKSTGTPTHLNIARDAQLLLYTLFRREDIINSKLIIYGASIGTQAAVHLARNNNEKITGLVVDGMMGSFTDVALATSPPEYHDAIRNYVISPYSAKEDFKYVENIKVLFIHSEEDFIPIKQAQAIYEDVKCVKKFWRYEGKHIEAPVKYSDTFVEYMNWIIN
jgi:pimeloyl-ACP methyl ester carboxylesterase